MTNSSIAVVAVFLFLAACDIGDPVYWWKPGVIEAAAQKDEDECVRAYRAGEENGHDCMHRRGYKMGIGKPEYAKARRSRAADRGSC